MRTWTTTHTVAAQPDAVLDVLTDPDACRHWAPVAFDVELDAPARRARLATGSRARVTGRLAGRPVGFDVEVDQATRERLALRATGPVALDVLYDLARRPAPAARSGPRCPSARAAGCWAASPPRPRTPCWARASSIRPSPASGAPPRLAEPDGEPMTGRRAWTCRAQPASVGGRGRRGRAEAPGGSCRPGPVGGRRYSMTFRDVTIPRTVFSEYAGLKAFGAGSASRLMPLSFSSAAIQAAWLASTEWIESAALRIGSCLMYGPAPA